MKYDAILHLTLKQNEIFLKCYQTRNFSYVAEHYHYTPSTISKTIHAMEEALGYELFSRTYHDLVPTDAANVLAQDWADLFTLIGQGLERADAAHRNDRPHIRIGFTGTTNFSTWYITDRLQQKADRQLMEILDFETRGMNDLLALLLDGYFDMIVGNSRLLPSLNQELYAWRKFFSSPEAVFIPLGHPLFNRELNSFADCREYPFLTLNSDEYPRHYKLLTDLAQKHGFVPKIAMSCINAESVYYNLLLGKGLYLASSLECDTWANRNIRKVDLTDEKHSDLLAIWKKSNTKPEVREIADCLTDAGL